MVKARVKIMGGVVILSHNSLLLRYPFIFCSCLIQYRVEMVFFTITLVHLYPHEGTIVKN